MTVNNDIDDDGATKHGDSHTTRVPDTESVEQHRSEFRLKDKKQVRLHENQDVNKDLNLQQTQQKCFNSITKPSAT